MGRCATMAKDCELFGSTYKIYVLYALYSKTNICGADYEELTYCCKSHGKYYYLSCGEEFMAMEVDSLEIGIEKADLVGVGKVEILIADLDEMFDDKETFWKKLDEPTDDNLKKLADECTDIPVNLTDALMGTGIGKII